MKSRAQAKEGFGGQKSLPEYHGVNQLELTRAEFSGVNFNLLNLTAEVDEAAETPLYLTSAQEPVQVGSQDYVLAGTSEVSQHEHSVGNVYSFELKNTSGDTLISALIHHYQKKEEGRLGDVFTEIEREDRNTKKVNIPSELPPGSGMVFFEKVLDFLQELGAQSRPFRHEVAAAPVGMTMQEWARKFEKLLVSRGYHPLDPKDRKKWERVYGPVEREAAGDAQAGVASV